MPLTEMGRRIKVPVGTPINYVKEVERFFHFTILLKDDDKGLLARNAPVTFKFAYENSESVEMAKGSAVVSICRSKRIAGTKLSVYFRGKRSAEVSFFS